MLHLSYAASAMKTFRDWIRFYDPGREFEKKGIKNSKYFWKEGSNDSKFTDKMRSIKNPDKNFEKMIRAK